jgi:hypothetical protein
MANPSRPAQGKADKIAPVIDISDSAAAAHGNGDGPSPEVVDALLEDDSTLARMHELAKRAEGINAETLAGMTMDSFERAVAGAGTVDEKMALAEYYGTLAKAGITPANTVKGFDELQRLLVRTYEDGELKPVEVQLKQLQLRADIAILSGKQSLVLEKHVNEAALEADESMLKLLIARQRGSVDALINEQQEGLRLKGTSVELAGKAKSVDITKALQDYEKENERLARKIGLQKARRRLLRRELIAPRIRVATILATLLIVLANLVADGPGHSHAPILGGVNSLWDSLYMPVRDGIVRTVNGHHSTVPQKPASASTGKNHKASQHPRKAAHRLRAKHKK